MEKENEKRKLLLVAVSVGVFLVIVLSAALLIFTPMTGGAAFAAARPGDGSSQLVPVGPGSAPIAQRGPASADATDMVRNAGDLQGLQTPPAGAASASAVQENNFYINGEDASSADGSNVVINVPMPSTPGVPAPGSRPAASGNAGSSSTVPVGSTTAARTAPAQTTAPAASAPVTPARTTPQATAAAKPTASAPAAQPAAGSASTPARASPAPAPAAAVTPARSTATPVVAARTTPSRAQSDYWIQTGAFSALVRAEGVKETLASKGLTSIIDNGDVNGQIWYRVRVGPYTSESEANYWLNLVKAIDGFGESQVRSTQR
ncbi:MAG: SPOR domain-containing protein [Treponema sp.]|jgi:DedD protein|nr:SPOR domain-containing protein [Treponema sp.]